MTSVPNPIGRFRSGMWKEISPELPAVLKDLLPTLKKRTDLSDKIKAMSDGGGYGIALESTWFQFIKELFQEYSDKELFKKSDLKEKLIAVLEILNMLDKPIDERWDLIKAYLVANIDDISGWETNWRKWASENRLIRRENGEYFTRIDGQEMQIFGAQTMKEDAWDMFQWSCFTGPLKCLFQFIALHFICEEVLNGGERFPKGNVIVLPEGQHGFTYFLRWHWFIKFPYRLKSVDWRPRRAHCSAAWLGADLLGSLYEKEEIPEVEMLQIDYEKLGMPKEWLDRLHEFQATMKMPLNTTLRFADGFQTAGAGAFFEYEGLPILWVNSTYTTGTQIIVPLKGHHDHSKEYATALRFLSHLCFEYDYAIGDDFMWIQGGAPRTTATPTRRETPMVMPKPEAVGRKLIPNTALQHAFALYREALTSPSPFLSFLRYFEILELGFKAKNDTKVKKWLSENAGKTRDHSATERYNELGKEGVSNLGEYIAKENRNAVAHVYLSDKKSGFKVTKTPDDAAHRSQFVKDNFLMRALARLMIQSGLVK